jgi:hypothetical protein
MKIASVIIGKKLAGVEKFATVAGPVGSVGLAGVGLGRCTHGPERGVLLKPGGRFHLGAPQHGGGV